VVQREVVDLDAFGIVDAEFEEGGVAVEFEVGFEAGSAGGLALALEFLDGEDIEGERVATETEFVERGGVVEETAFSAFVLAEEGIDHIQDHVLTQGREIVNIGNGNGEAPRVGFKPGEIIDAARGEAVEQAGDAGVVMIEERGDVDDTGDFPGEELGNERPSTDLIAFLAELEVAPDKIAEDGGLVKRRRVIAGLGAAEHTDFVVIGQGIEAGKAKVGGLFVPDDDVGGGEAGTEEALDDSGDDGGAGAAVGTGWGKHLDPNDVLGGNEGEPCAAGGGLPSEIRQGAVHHGANDLQPWTEGIGGCGVADSDDAGTRESVR